MGCCSSCATSPDRLMDMEVSKELNGDKDRAAKIQKLLFLGSGGSGKSTFFKQLRCIHGVGFTEKDRRVFKEHISAQIIEQMNRSVECIPYYNERLPHDFEPLQLSKEGQESARFMEEIGPECLVNEELAQHIEILWKEDAIRQIFENRAIYHIDDSSAYFFDQIERIGDLDHYLPTDMDILYVRYRTTGVIESKFSILGSNFHIFDVGGQQSERKKWIHCFENVTAVIFVASLSSYNEVLLEDESVLVMKEELNLFDQICNSRWFQDTAFILFMNKRDLFEQKYRINKIPLNKCFNDFRGDPNVPEQGMNFIKKKYLARNQNVQKQIYTHFTCATDRDNVENIFNDVQQVVIQTSLKVGGLI